MKSISGNAFPYLRVFGCARKMHFPEMLFSWPLNGCKLISVSILPSNSHFLENTERAEWEGDTPARREREREEEPKRARLRLSSPTASHPKTDHPRPRSSSPIASPFRKIDRPRVACRRTQSRSQHQSASEISPVVEPSRNRIMNFFFWVLFVFLD